MAWDSSVYFVWKKEMAKKRSIIKILNNEGNTK
jgi:hypothetical protein